MIRKCIVRDADRKLACQQRNTIAPRSISYLTSCAASRNTSGRTHGHACGNIMKLSQPAAAWGQKFESDKFLRFLLLVPGVTLVALVSWKPPYYFLVCIS